MAACLLAQLPGQLLHSHAVDAAGPSMAPAQGSSPGQQDRAGASSSSTSVGKAVPLATQLEEQQQATDQAAGVPPKP